MKEYGGLGTLAKLCTLIQTALKGKQDTIVTDDSLDKTGNTMVVSSPVRQIVTQEEWDALSVEERAKGLWVVDDGDEGGSGQVYSTEERRIGTWIDGKPIYRKVLNVVMGNLGVETFHATLEYVDYMVSNRFVVLGKGNSFVVLPNEFSYIGFHKTSKRLFSRVKTDDEAGQPATVILEYTKTTDNGVIV